MVCGVKRLGFQSKFQSEQLYRPPQISGPSQAEECLVLCGLD